MKRFPFCFIWYILAVIIVDIPPIFLFFLMHRFGWLGNLAPQIIATAIVFICLSVQAFLLLHFLNRRHPEDLDKNAWTAIAVSVLVFASFWIIIIGLIAWATRHTY